MNSFEQSQKKELNRQELELALAQVRFKEERLMEEFGPELKGDYHYKHIVNNLMTIARGLLEVDSNTLSEEGLEIVRNNIDALNQYLDLILNSENFREQEFTTAAGQFGDKRELNAKNYVALATKELAPKNS